MLVLERLDIPCHYWHRGGLSSTRARETFVTDVRAAWSPSRLLPCKHVKNVWLNNNKKMALLLHRFVQWGPLTASFCRNRHVLATYTREKYVFATLAERQFISVAWRKYAHSAEALEVKKEAIVRFYNKTTNALILLALSEASKECEGHYFINSLAGCTDISEISNGNHW